MTIQHMRLDADVAFLRAAAGYFDTLPVDGEDRAHWANVYNAENCRRIADRLAQIQAPDEGLVEAMARAICRARGWDAEACVFGGCSLSHDGISASYCSVRMWQNCVPDARAALTAARSHGGGM